MFPEPPNGCVTGVPVLWDACCEDWPAGEHFGPLERSIPWQRQCPGGLVGSLLLALVGCRGFDHFPLGSCWRFPEVLDVRGAIWKEQGHDLCGKRLG